MLIGDDLSAQLKAARLALRQAEASGDGTRIDAALRRSLRGPSTNCAFRAVITRLEHEFTGIIAC
jgi:hypothetical protein